MTEDTETSGRFPPGLLREVRGTVTVVVTDSAGTVTLWSRGAEALWGWSSQEALGTGLADLFTSDWAVRHRDGRVLDIGVDVCPLLVGERNTGFLLVADRRVEAQGARDEELMAWVFDQFPAPLAINDPEGRVLRHNRVMTRLTGREEDEMRGHSLTESVAEATTAEDERRVTRVAATGELETTERFVKVPGEAKAHAWVSDFFPLKDSTGRVRAVGVTSYDYSQQYGARERLALLSEARTRIGMSLDLAGTAREVAEVAVPRFADTVSVHLLDEVFRGELPPPGPLRRSVVLRRVVPLADGEEAVPGQPIHPSSSAVARCLLGNGARLIEGGASEVEGWFGGEVGQGVCSTIAVPIRARGTTLGLALFLRNAAKREPYGPDDLAVTEDLIARAAICVDNARRFTREHGIAVALQSALLPHGSPSHAAVETAARYLPAGGGAQVGGDWFDVIALPGSRVGLVVGDVVGHGVTASAIMGQLRTAVRTLADIELPPEELLTHLDDVVTHAADGESAYRDPCALGATCLYVVYDPIAGVCSLAAAGHPPPVLVRPDGTSAVVDMPVGPPLGLGSLPFEATDLAVPEGSLLALFTDGLIETREHDVDARLEELRAAIARPSPSLDALCDTVLGALHSGPAADDVALLIARTRGLAKDQVAEWELHSDPAVVSDARRLVDDRLAAWGLEDLMFTTELVVSELVTNAIRYGVGPVHLRLIKDRSLTCEVSDGSASAPHLRRARLSDEGGRGLFLIAELTQRWGTRYTMTGKTIWAEQALDVARSLEF
ncbi:SpoIIE family protein phosphatase [Streptomyces sp. NPDC008092]|uniref:SpoIIE family protein phosphatase n=1 Tax=Streptomyces sp. NPDC008092 TaxID=3364808 RepID=UPI0036EB38E5